VTIRIVAVNQAPVLLEPPLPVLMATQGEPFTFDFSGLFNDPEGNDLTFSLSELTPFAIGSGLELSTVGLLSGTPTDADVGSYQLTLIVSDGGVVAESVVALEVAAATLDETDPDNMDENGVPDENDEDQMPDQNGGPDETPEDMNSAPQFLADTVFNQSVTLGNPIVDITPIFTDADGDTLIYRMSNPLLLPDGVSIDPDTGVISGTPLEAGFFSGLRVRAADPSFAADQSTFFFIDVQDE